MQITKEHTNAQVSATTAEQSKNGFLRAFTALRHRNFRLFWSGQLISLIGTWMQTTGQAIPFQAYKYRLHLLLRLLSC